MTHPPHTDWRAWWRYTLSWLPVWLGLALALVGLGYEGSFLWLNAGRLTWLDVVMPHFTHLGDGLLLFGGVSLWCLAQRRMDLWLLLVATLLGVMVWVFLLKNFIFHGWHRPSMVFAYPPKDFFMISTRDLSSFSFPSGHATAAAAATLVAALAASSPRLGPWLWGLMGILLAYSRVYIGVHFGGDILAGSLLGWAWASALYAWLWPWLYRWQHTWSQPERWLQLARWLSVLLILVGLFSLYFRYYAL